MLPPKFKPGQSVLDRNSGRSGVIRAQTFMGDRSFTEGRNYYQVIMLYPENELTAKEYPVRNELPLPQASYNGPFPKIFSRGFHRCRCVGLYLFQDPKHGGHKEKWSVIDGDTGKEIATYWPHTKRLWVQGENVDKVDWETAFEMIQSVRKIERDTVTGAALTTIPGKCYNT